MKSSGILELIAWFRLLPNIKCLYVSSSELKYWFINGRTNGYLNTLLQHLDQLYIDCSTIINSKLSEEMMVPLLSFVLDQHHFPQLKCLRFICCKHISSAWCNIHEWIDFISTRINEHQLESLRFDFIEEEDEVTDMQTGDEIITTTKPPCIVHIHRFISENRIAFWIERK